MKSNKLNSTIPIPTPRAQATRIRSYCRPKEDGKIETWKEAVERVIGHQRWLWERAQGKPLSSIQEAELTELKELILYQKVSPAGRTMWLGGTEISRTRESSQYNCSFAEAETLFDIVDMFWLLLNGVGVGFSPIVGNLHGFRKPLDEIQVIRSKRTIKDFEEGNRGRENNLEIFDPATKVWTISVGDSAASWAKVAGKLLVGKYPANSLVLDYSEVRAAGVRLKGYGWISSGDEMISKAFPAIARILSNKADQLLNKIDILDIMNHLGSVLSSRRSAEIALVPYKDPEWKEFATAKKDYHKYEDRTHRRQSNNSLVFYEKPSKSELEEIFNLMQEAGGSEPGFINGTEARKRAIWFKGFNPCGEIILSSAGLCNLCEVNLLAFKDDMPALKRAINLIARANYRQTCTDLRDGILQEAWHTNNEFLRLCGVGLTGITARPDLTGYDYKVLKNTAVHATYEMSNELGIPKPKNTTTIKPGGTIPKCMSSNIWGEVPEGVHKPLGKYIFNEIIFSKHEPLVEKHQKAGYVITPHPNDSESVLIRFPVYYNNIPFTKKQVIHKDGTKETVEINTETAIEQLDRYKMLMDNWCEQNVSCTISYDPVEIPSMIKWLLKNWDSYIGVSFLYRVDPTKTAADLGFHYLPQTVVSEKTYTDYVSTLKPIKYESIEYVPIDDSKIEECLTGACPIR